MHLKVSNPVAIVPSRVTAYAAPLLAGIGSSYRLADAAWDDADLSSSPEPSSPSPPSPPVQVLPDRLVPASPPMPPLPASLLPPSPPRRSAPSALLPPALPALPPDPVPTVLVPPPGRQPTLEESRLLACIRTWRDENRGREALTPPKPHPLLNISGATPAMWRVLSFELRILRHRYMHPPCAHTTADLGATVTDIAQKEQKHRAEWSKHVRGAPIEHVFQPAVAENERLGHVFEELHAVRDAIEYLTTEMPDSNDVTAWIEVWHDAGSLKDLARELRNFQARLRRDAPVIESLREQTDAALMLLTPWAPEVYPTWAPDVFSRPSRRIPLTDARQHKILSRIYDNHCDSLTELLHQKLPDVQRALDEAKEIVEMVRGAVEG